jgi:single-stranded DNA-binding protein
MSAVVLLSGKIVREPERKVSKLGKPYASATVRDGYGDDATWWRVFAFSESAAEELLGLRDGDAVAASGSFKAELYNGRDGARISLSMVADRLISARKLKRQRDKERREQPGSNNALLAPRIEGAQAQAPLDSLNDDLPEGWSS